MLFGRFFLFVASCISAVLNSLAIGVFIVVGLYALLGGLLNCLDD